MNASFDRRDHNADSNRQQRGDANLSAGTETIANENAGENRTSADHPSIGTFDLGIVFVHGMGDTKPGDTLIRFMNPTLEWIKRWANKDYTLSGLRNLDMPLTLSVLAVELPYGVSPDVDRDAAVGCLMTITVRKKCEEVGDADR